MKTVKRVILVLVLLVIVGVVALYMNLNRIVRRTVEQQSTDSLKLQTTLGSANLAIFGGEVKLNDLQIANPPGYTAPEMLKLGAAEVNVSYGQLREDPVHVKSITIRKPVLIIEQQNGKLNFKTAMDQIPATPPSTGEQKPLKLVIDDLTVQDAQVIVRPGDLTQVPGLSALTSSLPKEITVPIPSVTLKNIGSGEGNQNGAAVKDVVMQVVTALADAASKSGGLPDQLKGLMNVNLDSVKAQLGAEFQKQLGGLTKNLPGGVGDLVKDPNGLVKDPGKAIQQGIGNVLGNKSPNGPTTKPDPAKSLEKGVEGLFGGKKKD